MSQNLDVAELNPIAEQPVTVADGMHANGYSENVFSFNRWLEFRTTEDLVTLSRFSQSTTQHLSHSENAMLTELMAISGYCTETEQRKAKQRCIKRLGLAAAVMYGYRNDWLEIVSQMTLRKDPRLCIKRTNMGRVMAAIMGESPLVGPIKKTST